MKAKKILPIAALGLAMASPCFAGGPGAGTMPVIREPQSGQATPGEAMPGRSGGSAQPESAQPGTQTQNMVPDQYVWDGKEKVGFVNNKTYYLGPGDVWMPMTDDRTKHFDDWLRMNPDWQSHAVKNVQYDKIQYYPGQTPPSQNMNQDRNSSINRTDQNGPPTDHNGPPE